MYLLLFFIGFLVLISSLIYLVVALIKKSFTRKRFFTLLTSGFVLMIIGFIMFEPSTETSGQPQEEAKADDQIKDAKDSNEVEEEQEDVEKEEPKEEPELTEEEKQAQEAAIKAEQEAKAKAEAEKAAKEKAAKEQEEKLKQEQLKAKSLGYNINEFSKRFNNAAKEFESSFRVNNPAITSGSVQDVATIMLNDKIAMNVSINKENQSVRDILMIGQGDGSMSSGLDIMSTIGIIVAATNPELSPDGRGDILRKLGLMDESGLSDEQTSTVKNGIKYTFEVSDMLGIVFTASNESDKE